MAEDNGAARRYEEYLERQKQQEAESFQRAQERYEEERRSDQKFNRYLIIGLIVWLVIGIYACDNENPYGEGCYDADPTQYVEVECFGE